MSISGKKNLLRGRHEYRFSQAMQNKGLCSFALLKDGKTFVEEYDIRGDLFDRDITADVKSILDGIRVRNFHYSIFVTPNDVISVLAPTSYDGSMYMSELYELSVIADLFCPLRELQARAFKQTPSLDEKTCSLVLPINGENNWNKYNGLIDIKHGVIIARSDARLSLAPHKIIHRFPTEAIARLCDISLARNENVVSYRPETREKAERVAYSYIKRTFFS